MAYIIVQQEGKVNAIFRVNNPERIAFWEMVASKLSGTCGFVSTKIIRRG